LPATTRAGYLRATEPWTAFCWWTSGRRETIWKKNVKKQRTLEKVMKKNYYKMKKILKKKVYNIKNWKKL